MTATNKTARIKTAAQGFVAQSESDAAATIRKIGDISRELLRTRTLMNDEIAVH